MVDEQISKNVKDPSLIDWFTPEFSTTTDTDRVVAGITLMATLSTYFKFEESTMCGIPEVTLLGTVEDWEMLKAKFDRLLEFEVNGHDYMARWHAMLVKVGDGLIASARGED